MAIETTRTWIILNSRDMFMGSYDSEDEAHAVCRKLNEDPNRLSLYNVVPGPPKGAK